MLGNSSKLAVMLFLSGCSLSDDNRRSSCHSEAPSFARQRGTCCCPGKAGPHRLRKLYDVEIVDYH